MKRLALPAASLGVFAARRAVRSVAVRARWPSALRTHAQALVVAGAAVPALAGFVLLAAQSLQSLSPGGDSTSRPPTPEPVVLYARPLCTFANDDARAALIDGADGGASVVVGGRSFWLFGDTLFAGESGKQIEQNAIAWSNGEREDGCQDDKQVVDVNGDGQANLLDVYVVARIALVPGSYDPLSQVAADIDKDGANSLLDIVMAVKNSTLVEPHAAC
jgi:hypothetical protein